MYYILNIAFVIFTFFNVYANDETLHLNKLNFCAQTEGVVDDYEPDSFVKNNNLLRKTGVIAQNEGEIIIIKGTVLNEKCNPVDGVIVHLWHVNDNGKYIYSPLRTNVNQEPLLLNSNESFVGNGTAVTNTSGEFRFITIEPGSVFDLSPYVNVRAIYRNKIGAQASFKLKEMQVIKEPVANYNVHDIGDKKHLKQSLIKVYNMQIILSSETADQKPNE